MSSSSQSSYVTTPRQISLTGVDCAALETEKRGHGKKWRQDLLLNSSYVMFNSSSRCYFNQMILFFSLSCLRDHRLWLHRMTSFNRMAVQTIDGEIAQQLG
ncbi:hypothetical protein QYF36_026641 [Acer negundo]|nr:hypothetical protein QYF36_026641 [Acer negundo]